MVLKAFLARAVSLFAITVGSAGLLACEQGLGSAGWVSTEGVVHTASSVGVGTPTPRVALEVKGAIHAEEVKVTVEGWPDYVFDDDYSLTPLDELARYIDREGHLPGIPSSEKVRREGVALGAVQVSMLEKVEELTLHILALERRNQALARRLEALEGVSDLDGQAVGESR